MLQPVQRGGEAMGQQSLMPLVVSMHGDTYTASDERLFGTKGNS